VVSGTEGLYHAFNRADVLVSDISSVITDFLASEKPYVVTDPSATSEEDFRREFPSAAGAWILTGDGTGVGEAIRDALGEDRHAEKRRRTAAYLLGSVKGDPLARFDAAIDDAVAATSAKAANRPVP
jgi:CDP-glycerol glycerophosphotransferase (TagB/SpsB family)